MTKKKLIVRIAIGAIILAILTTVMIVIFDSAVVSNDIMLGQMSNSDESYLLVEYYNRIKSVSSTIYGLASMFIVGATVFNIYKFIKTKEKIK